MTLFVFYQQDMCEQINSEVLKTLPGEEIKLIADDSVDCSPSLLHKVKQRLQKHAEVPPTLQV